MNSQCKWSKMDFIVGGILGILLIAASCYSFPRFHFILNSQLKIAEIYDISTNQDAKYIDVKNTSKTSNKRYIKKKVDITYPIVKFNGENGKPYFITTSIDYNLSKYNTGEWVLALHNIKEEKMLANGIGYILTSVLVIFLPLFLIWHLFSINYQFIKNKKYIIKNAKNLKKITLPKEHFSFEVNNQNDALQKNNFLVSISMKANIYDKQYLRDNANKNPQKQQKGILEKFVEKKLLEHSTNPDEDMKKLEEIRKIHKGEMINNDHIIWKKEMTVKGLDNNFLNFIKNTLSCVDLYYNSKGEFFIDFEKMVDDFEKTKK